MTARLAFVVTSAGGPLTVEPHVRPASWILGPIPSPAQAHRLGGYQGPVNHYRRAVVVAKDSGLNP